MARDVASIATKTPSFWALVEQLPPNQEGC